MIKTPLRYPGGKSRAAKLISSLIPEFEEYREPFVGGGSVFIYMKQQKPSKKYWINDIYQNLYSFWKICQADNKTLVGEIENFKSEYSDGKELHRFLSEKIETFDEKMRAAAFFVFNRITFSGTSESGGFSESAYQYRFTDTSIQRVSKLAKLLKETEITNFDYEVLLKASGQNVFFFLDPPYYSATKSALYGKKGALHKEFDHERLAENLKNTEHKWLLTYDDSTYIRDKYSYANIVEWDLVYGMRNVNKDNINQNGKELFISNYDIGYMKQQQFNF